MKIEVYYDDSLLNDLISRNQQKSGGAPDLAPQPDFNLIWSGSPEDLKLNIAASADDAEVLETIYDHFNLHQPGNYVGHTSLSEGGIVGLNGRYYLCLLSGWQLLEDFDPQTRNGKYTREN